MSFTKEVDARLALTELKVALEAGELDSLRSQRVRWHFEDAPTALTFIIGGGELAIKFMNAVLPPEYKESGKWMAFRVGVRALEALAVGGVIIQDKLLAARIEDKQSIIDWDSRQIGRVKRALFADYLDAPLYPGG